MHGIAQGWLYNPGHHRLFSKPDLRISVKDYPARLCRAGKRQAGKILNQLACSHSPSAPQPSSY